MIGLKEIVLAGFCLSSSVVSSQNSFGRKTYDIEKMQFEKLPSGINEDVMNQFENKNYCYINHELYTLFDNEELGYHFISGKGNVEISGLAMCMNIFRSFEKIDYLNNVGFSKVDSSDVYLKRTIMELNLIENMGLSEYEKIKRMYGAIVNRMNFNENSDQMTYIEKILGGHDAVCRDAVSTIYPLFNSYGIDTRICYGENNLGDVHAWLRVKIDSMEFDLDPTYYRNYFVPLDKRVEESYSVSELKDRFLDMVRVNYSDLDSLDCQD